MAAKKTNKHLLEIQKLFEQDLSSSDTETEEKEDENGNVEVVVFEKRKKKKKEINANLETDEKQNAEKSNLNFNQTRYELIQFGISGFAKEDKEKAKIALAIKLGAKPPKRKYVNYKELMQQKQKEKKEIKAENDDLAKKTIKSSNKKKINSNVVRGFDVAFGKTHKPKKYKKKKI